MEKVRMVAQKKGTKYFLYPETLPLRYRGKYVSRIEVLPEDLKEHEKRTVETGSEVSPAVFSTRTVEELKGLVESRKVFCCSREEYQRAAEFQKNLQEEL
ncbi:hypothetical protein DRN85_05710 [Methanosarcinales archaeon]|nr:MAG: hypothetical protein DRN85_05710 [Methanosarcinales archaeon]